MSSFTGERPPNLPFEPESMDFGYSLGVLASRRGHGGSTASRRPGAQAGRALLVYLYYAFDNRPRWFRALWRASDVARRVIARQPSAVRHVICDGLAGGVYFPLARGAALAERSASTWTTGRCPPIAIDPST